MASLKVIASVVNLRLGPVEDLKSKGNIIGNLINGAPFESVNETTNKLGPWFQDVNGHWVWGGGLGTVADNLHLVLTTPAVFTNYNQLIENIPDQWKDTRGDGVIVAIIDTGLATGHKANFNVIKGFNAITETEDEFEDAFGHGTFVAGVIASNGNASNITGVASKVRIIVVKVADRFVDTDVVAKGIKWLDERCPIKPDVINISLDFPASTNAAFFNSKFDSFQQKNISVFASAADDSGVFDGDIFFPASALNVNAVAKLDSSLVNNGHLNSKIAFVSGDYAFSSVNDFTPNKGSSYVTALLSGSMALAIPVYRASIQTISLQQYFREKLQQFLPLSFDNTTKIYKL